MLCIFDSLFAGFSLIEYGLKKGFKLILWTTPIYVDIWPKLIYPFHNIANTLSVFVTVAIAIERWEIILIENSISNRYIEILDLFINNKLISPKINLSNLYIGTYFIFHDYSIFIFQIYGNLSSFFNSTWRFKLDAESTRKFKSKNGGFT